MAKAVKVETALLKELFRYDPETGYLYYKKARGFRRIGERAGTRHPRLRSVKINGRRVGEHRIIWQMQNGPIPKSLVIDHIDGNPFNNLLQNLRVVTLKINCRNQRHRKNNTSGYIGVYWKSDKKRWTAELHVDWRKKFLGYFDTKEEAAAVYRQEMLKYGFHPNHGRKLESVAA